MPGSKLFDYHVHTYLCGHAVGTAEEYVRAAIDAGLDEIGFAEHMPMYWLPPAERDPTIAMREDQLEGYVRTVLDLRAQYPQIRVSLGIEADYIPGREGALRSLLAPYPWDYVYGSVHYVDGWGFDNPAYKERYAEWEIDRLYEAYFGLVCEAARTGLFDVVGHIDVIKKWGHRPAEPPARLYEQVASELASREMVVELNTAGYRKPVAELYPAPELLRALVRAGVELTLGSDAHAPGEVGHRLGDAVGELRAAGASSLVRFRDRERLPVRI